jgi:hypothetical protein
VDIAARRSGTENIYKIYAESLKDPAHLETILNEAQQIIDEAASDPLCGSSRSRYSGNGRTRVLLQE